MKNILLLSVLAFVTAATAAPMTSNKGAPDARGVKSFWVKCDNGNVTVVQCFRDEVHCGESSSRPLPQVAALACDSIQGLTMEPIKK